MKVLICWHGAVEPAYRRLFDELVSLGVEVRLIAPSGWSEGGRFQRYSARDTDRYDSVVLKTAFTDHMRAFFYPNVMRIIREVKGFKPDIIHIMEEPFSFAAYEFLWIKKLAGSNARTVLFSFENIDFAQKFPFSVFQSFNLRNTDAIIVVPEESERLWKWRGFSKTIFKIPLGVDVEIFHKTPGGKPGNTFKVGYVGRVVKEKGLETVIESLNILLKRGQYCNFYIAGNGDYKTTLSQLIKRSGIEGYVHFLGVIEQVDLPAFYSSLDTLVLPSMTTPIWKEQFGRVLPEAMACGTPVIGSSSGEIPNVIGSAGMIFPEGDAESLANCIEAIMSDAVLRRDMSEKGREKASKEFSWEAVAKRYVGLYKELLKKETGGIKDEDT